MTVVRSARPEEWREVRALRLRALADAPDAFGSTLAAEGSEPEEVWRDRWLGHADGVTLVAEQGDRFVGMAFGGPAPGRPKAAGIYGMWVDPDARRQGIGAALLERLAEWARSAGYVGMGLGVTTTNAAAIALYERLGFVDSGEQHPLRDGSHLTIQIMISPFDPQS